MADTQLIGVDWGTSHLRAFRIGEGGALLESRSTRDGMGELAPDAFGPTLEGVISDWRHPGLEVICCGVVGSRQGWLEVPYCTAPAGFGDLAAGALSTGGALACRILPGVCVRRGCRLVDVMRGEEVQALGAEREGLIVCPGTHAKWVKADQGRIIDVRTFMTGELHGLLARQSVLRHSVGETAKANGAFLEGVGRSLQGEPLLSALFGIRIASLDDRQSLAEGSARLSGLLIGAEIAAARHQHEAQPVTLVGAPALASLYAAALDLAGFGPIEILDDQAITARGLWRVWRAAQ